ncbi:hypothetical protein ACF1GY_35980 [Streptomyces sp. NPDC014684]|uniref:hypothetical protein n=1 Tax=Streptomyces sp. NPDC014684 TaxID=3364880 RepID=UPI0037005EAF
MPRKRPGRIRTKNTNRRAPLLLSTMAPEDFNVRPDEVKSIACPDCRTWRRIMGDTVLKIREHCISDKVADGEKHVTCPGSNQLVVIDVDIRRWQARQNRLLRDAMPQENRRAAQQFYKPLPAPAAPVARIHAGVTLETARQAYAAHLEECVSCATGQHCTHGGALAHRYVLVRKEEPARREARKQSGPAARKEQWNQRGGETVETANNQCRPRLEGAVSEYRGPQVPTKPLRINA